MRYLLPILCIILYIFVPQEYVTLAGVSNGQLINCIGYHYFHASWAHVLVNALAFYLIYTPVRTIWQKRLADDWFFINMYICATLAGISAAQDTPTVGLSGIIFAILGALILLNPTKKQLQNYVYIAIAVVLQCFFGRSNVLLHLYAFAFGALAVVLHVAVDRLRIK